MIPIYLFFTNIPYIFNDYGDYASQARYFAKDANYSLTKNTPLSPLFDREKTLNVLREQFNMAQQTSKDFGGYKFINFSPTADQREAMLNAAFDYDIFAVWFFDLIENKYQWKWSYDEKNHCLKGALSCLDEGSPNYKKMVFFYHNEPTKIMLMAWAYDTLFTHGVWENVDETGINW